MTGRRQRRTRRRHSAGAGSCQSAANGQPDESPAYEEARGLVQRGLYAAARSIYGELARGPHRQLAALATRDLAALDALDGDITRARRGFQAAIDLDDRCQAARANQVLLEAEGQNDQGAMVANESPNAPLSQATSTCRVAIVSLLFNWPSTGGGNVHTFELARFLARAGYDVCHFYACYPAWGIGRVLNPPPYVAKELAFEPSDWNAPAIQRRYRQSIDEFAPDHVIITDSWNFKPLLADALRSYPYTLRFQALECLCPLNNVRLLLGPEGPRQCGRHQLATPNECRVCLSRHGHHSGSLHQAERTLSGVGSVTYDAILRRAYAEAEAVFVINPPTAALVSPHCRQVVVSPPGMDPEGFPWPWPKEPDELRTPGRQILFFAGLVQETMKGFGVLHQACELLWKQRHDFELVATGDPPGQTDEFTRLIGWVSQDQLPRHLRAADMCIFPTLAQDALGRTAVESMAVGRPVIASRLGGLPFTLAEGVTGLLFESGNVEELAAKIATLLDDPALRERMGQAGRERFEERFRWDAIIRRDYAPLLVRNSHQHNRT